MALWENCQACGEKFRTYASVRATGKGKYCSKACYTRSQSTGPRMVRFVCETCGKVVERAANGARVFRFCAKRCQRFRDGDRVIRGGYWLVRVPMLERKALHIRAHRRRKHRAWMPEHIVAAERALGRALGRGEVVHHINCDRLDNRPSNLLICDRAYHAWLHGEMSRRYAHEHFGRVA